MFEKIKKYIKERITKDMETKTKKRNNFILEEYEKGRILQIDKNIDNKEFLKAK